METFSDKKFQELKKKRARRDEDEKTLIDGLRALRLKLVEDGADPNRVPECEAKPEAYPRRSASQPDCEPDEHKRAMLDVIYVQEALLISTHLAAAKNMGLLRTELPLSAPNIDKVFQQGIIEKIHHETDIFTLETGLVEEIDGFTGFEHMDLLEEFFGVCRVPNEAEIAALAKLNCVEASQIRKWFTWKMDHTKSYEEAKCWATLVDFLKVERLMQEAFPELVPDSDEEDGLPDDTVQDGENVDDNDDEGAEDSYYESDPCAESQDVTYGLN